MTIFWGLLAFVWAVLAVRAGTGAIRLPHVRDFPPAADAECPRISILFAARDEEEKLPRALETLLSLDYPVYEVIAVNDRSADATPQILDEVSHKDARLKVVHITKLPPGWLGKTHALWQGYECAGGEWLVFTDADVHFAPSLLRRAVTLAKQRHLDHLTLLGLVEMHNFWERVVLSFFAMGFHIYTDPARASDPRSGRYIGVGAFQLVRREAYEESGTHQRLAMEVVDDMKLGKIIKQAGFRSGVAVATEALTVRWHSGLGNIIRGVEKNFFASAGYRVPLVSAQLFILLVLNVLPFVAVFALTGPARLLAAVSVAIIVGFHGTVARHLKISPLYALTHPAGALIFFWMLLRSTAVTLWRGGIVWRDTFYPLKDLRKGLV